MKAKTQNNLFDILSQWPSMLLIMATLCAAAVTLMAAVQANLYLFIIGMGTTGILIVLEVQWVITAVYQQHPAIASPPLPPIHIKDEELRARLIKAYQFGQRMAHIADTTPSDVLRQRLNVVIAGVTDQLMTLYRLAQQLDQHRAHLLLNPAWRNLSQTINELQSQLAQAKGEASKRHLSQMMQHKQQQWQMWQQLQNQQQQVLQQLDTFMATLEVMYTQLLLVNSNPETIYHLQHLQTDLTDEITAIADLATAMADIYVIET